MRSVAISFSFFFFNDTATTEIYTLSLHDALPISQYGGEGGVCFASGRAASPVAERREVARSGASSARGPVAALFLALLRSEEHTSELQSRLHLVCRLLLEKKKKKN